MNTDLMKDKNESVADQSSNKDGQQDNTAPKLDFSVDYNIPTLDEIALPGNESDTSKNFSSIPVPPHILKSTIDKHIKETLSPEVIEKICEDIQSALIPEVEKAISFALNNVLATVMDQASRMTKNKVHESIEKNLPALLKKTLENISQNDT